MIPKFPNFKKLELGDKKDIEKITKQYLPYSDFNFTSMWCWDVKNETLLSILNGNFVVKFSDYLSGKNFFSIFGVYQINKSVRELIGWLQNTEYQKTLRLVPEFVISELDPKEYKIVEEPDQADYIYDTSSLATYKGKKLRGKRNLLNRFIRNYKFKVKRISLKEKQAYNEIMDFYERWMQWKGLQKKDILFEYQALKNLLNYESNNAINVLGVYVCDNLIGFGIFEFIHHDYAILHFDKADFSRFIGVYSYLINQIAIAAIQGGCKMLNYEQDLGILGLKKAKKDLSPLTLLRKYKVSL